MNCFVHSNAVPINFMILDRDTKWFGNYDEVKESVGTWLKGDQNTSLCWVGIYALIKDAKPQMKKQDE